MRIISGQWKGRRLVSFNADHIRPTTDRVKETLFNKLMGRIEGARVLDLFSGTGNLGLESLSRGARHVDLVESHKKSVKIIRENMGLLKAVEGIRLHEMDAFVYLKKFDGEPYDLILADPPFTQTLGHQVAVSVSQSQALAMGGWMMMEVRANEPILESYPGLNLLDRREFGDKHLVFFERVIDEVDSGLPR